MYRVGPGDTLIGVARQFAVDVEDVARDNRLDADARLRVGALLKLQVRPDMVDRARGAEAAAPPAEAARADADEARQKAAPRAPRAEPRPTQGEGASRVEPRPAQGEGASREPRGKQGTSSPPVRARPADRHDGPAATSGRRKAQG
jgi:membrane-bound lytic murein transglycosylase D